MNKPGVKPGDIVNGDGLDDLIVGAFRADPASGTDAGKSYMVFGKTDTTAVDLATIAGGSGGFVLNGQSTNDWSGRCVSSAGDVNGVGFGDLIVGAHLADPAAGTDAGKSYVIFGGATAYTSSIVDYLGDSGDNTLTGTTANETFIGGAGDDILSGVGGKDVIYGGVGSDTFILNASNLANLADNSNDSSSIMRIDGGTGIDSLQLSGGASLDLTASGVISRVSSIERIDLGTDAGANTLTLGLQDVLDLSGMNLINAGSKAGLCWTGGSYLFAATESCHQLIVSSDAGESSSPAAASLTAARPQSSAAIPTRSTTRATMPSC